MLKPNPTIRIYKFLSYLTISTWIGVGILSIYSISNDLILWPINLIVGVIFMLIGVYFYLKSKNTILISSNEAFVSQEPLPIRQFIRLELLLILVNLFISVVFITATISRVIGEGVALFG